MAAGNWEATDLSELIRRQRTAAALTQRQLAELSGVSLAMIRDIEQGRTLRPRPASLRRLARVLSIAESGDASRRDRRQRRAHPDHGGVLTLRVLGPLRVSRAGASIEVRSGRQRALLGMLAVADGAPIPRRGIIDTLWAGGAPDSATHLLQTHVSELRRTLGTDLSPPHRRSLVRSEHGCYRIDERAARSDLNAFRRQVRRARLRAASGHPGEAFTLYGEALDLWRGPVLADIEELHLHPLLHAIHQERAAVAVEFADAGLELRAHREVLTRLVPASLLDPLNGALGARLMIALAGSGQQVAALDFFDRTRRQLNNELGIGPDTQLLYARTAVLRGSLAPVPPAG
jgi:DNA-binding SARP family transcriptional activator/DNA-binding XRE family transcriptional regulator